MACGPGRPPEQTGADGKKEKPCIRRAFPNQNNFYPSVFLEDRKAVQRAVVETPCSLSLSLLYAAWGQNSAFLIENWVTIW